MNESLQKIVEDRMAAMNKRREISLRRVTGFGLAAMLGLSACAQKETPGLTADGQQETFSTPENAARALVAASRNDDMAQLLKVLGPQAQRLISSGDPVADNEGRERFTDAYDASHDVEKQGDNKAVLVIGDEEWPLPIPLLRENGRWRFDTASGQQEILNRRIGRNELKVIDVCRAYVEAQRDYAAQHRLPDGRVEYAQRIVSAHGRHDGLYWPVEEGEEESPLGPLMAQARAEGYDAMTHEKPQPYHGYYYRILKQQGKNAPDGQKSYIAGGHMTGGFALVAFPAQYGDSGIMTFIVNQHGIVFEKNLGADTPRIAMRMTQYDPDKSWDLPKQ
jgi:hypothetical protein